MFELQNLQKVKQGAIAFFVPITVLLALVLLVRFVPFLDDLLSGRPQYAKALTTVIAQEFSNVAQGRFPVLLLGEDNHCDTVPAAQITDDQIAGILYALTYSEHHHFSCMTTYAVPVDPSRFRTLTTIHPEAVWASGPRLTHPTLALAVARIVHVYPPAYLEKLHWRSTVHFPLPSDQASKLAVREYDSRNSAVRSDEEASLHLDFNRIRTLVRMSHDRLNSRLFLATLTLGSVDLGLILGLISMYKQSARELQFYGERLPAYVFLRSDLGETVVAARTKHFEKERNRKAEQKKREAESLSRQSLAGTLRSVLSQIQDASLHARATECTNRQASDLNQMKQLWEEVQDSLGQRSPQERLSLLIESLKPYCSDEETSACSEQAAAILNESGFRPARNYLVSMHEQFRTRMQQVDESAPNNGQEKCPPPAPQDRGHQA